jgi:hypothetical protein
VTSGLVGTERSLPARVLDAPFLEPDGQAPLPFGPLAKEIIVAHRFELAFLAAALAIGATGAAAAQDLPVIAVLLKDHKFTPAEIHAPTGKPLDLLVTNADNDADEFEWNVGVRARNAIGELGLS